MSKTEISYIYNGQEYPVIITRKRMRSIRYTFRNGCFYVSAPRLFVTEAKIFEGLDKFAPKLIKADVKTKARGENYIYILGEKYDIGESGEITLSNGQIIKYKNQEDLDKKLKKWYLSLMEERTRYYEGLMNIQKPYKVRVQKMTSRYGSNSSQTHSINYSLILLHYPVEIIDSVVVHELAHDKVRNHSNNFYNVVYQYCQKYKEFNKRLRKGEFAW